jgi:RNA polymerase sigma-70 factor (ECF subfamily)
MRLTSARFGQEGAPLREATVHALPHALDDRRLLSALRADERRAPTLFFQRYAPRVQRILARILGQDESLADLVNETFFRALERINAVEDEDGLKPWLTTIAVFVARERIRQRKRQKWLELFGHEAPEVAAPAPSEETKEAVKRLYHALDEMPEKERVVFALRFIEGMELTEVAAACDLSLATVKRVLQRAERRFVAFSERDALLREWMRGGERWGSR